MTVPVGVPSLDEVGLTGLATAVGLLGARLIKRMKK
jgi:hypothetical protein